MRRVLVFLLCIIMMFLSTGIAEAKLLPQAGGSGKKATTTTKRSGTGGGISISPKLRSDRKALAVSFGNLQNASSVSYSLIYKTNGQEEAAGGTVSGAGNSAARELLFGTCSKNVCRYHTNITNARFEVTYTLTNGKKYLKRYRIKI